MTHHQNQHVNHQKYVQKSLQKKINLKQKKDKKKNSEKEVFDFDNLEKDLPDDIHWFNFNDSRVLPVRSTGIYKYFGGKTESACM